MSSADAKAVIERGYRVIHAASDYFYLVRVPSYGYVLIFTGLRER